MPDDELDDVDPRAKKELQIAYTRWDAMRLRDHNIFLYSWLMAKPEAQAVELRRMTMLEWK